MVENSIPKSIRLLYAAENDIEQSCNDMEEYTMTWLYAENILCMVNETETHFRLLANFPIIIILFIDGSAQERQLPCC